MNIRWFFISLLLALMALLSARPARADLSSQLHSIAEPAAWPEAVAVRVVSGQAPELAYYGEAKASRRYLLGSVSKTFTALTVLRLVEAGALALDADVARLLPAVRWQGTTPGRVLTVRDLLQHRSGINTADGMGEVSDDLREWKAITLRRAPGAGFEYSNLNYVLLGLVVEQSSSRPFAQVLQEQVLAPMAMHSTGLALGDEGADLAGAHQYWFGLSLPHKRTQMTRLTAPAGFVATTAQDMSKFLELLLRRDQSFLSAELWQQMLTPPAGARGYGLGVWVFPWGEGSSFAHDGMLAGDAASFQIWPQDGVAVAVMTPLNEGIFAPARDAVLNAAYREAKQQAVPAYTAQERWLRAVLGLGLALGLVLTGRRLLLWSRAKRPSLRLRGPYVRRWWLAVLVAVSVPALAIWWFAIPLQVLSFQPDLGLALLLSPVLSLLAKRLRLAQEQAAPV